MKKKGTHKTMSENLLNEEQQGNSTLMQETFISHTIPPPKANFCKNCLLKLFCCFNKNDVLEETHVSDDNNFKVKIPNHLVKSSLDLHDEMKNNSEDSSHELQKPNNNDEEKTAFYNNNLKVSSQLAKKNGKRCDKRKFSSEDPVKHFPINKVFILFNSDKSNFLLAKITQKFLTIPCKQKSGSSNPIPAGNNIKNEKNLQNFNDNPNNIFSLYEKGIKYDTENWEKVCPEKLAKYIAKRSKSPNQNFIIDAFCGIGGNSIQFAQEWEFVVSIDYCEKQLNYLKHNAGVYGISDKIDYILADYLKLSLQNKYKPDLVFLNPPCEKKNELEKFSILKDIQPDMIEITKKTFEMTKNLIILFPRFSDFSDVSQMITESLPSLDEEELLKPIEIELVYFNNIFENVLIHYGSSARISPNDEFEFINSYVNKDNLDIQSSIKFMRYICKKIGNRRVISHILTAEAEQMSENETLFQHFIDELRFSGVLTVEEQQEYLIDYMKHNSLLTPADTKNKFASTLVDQSPISFENKLMKKNDNEYNFSFTDNKKPSVTSQTNAINLANSPNFVYLQKKRAISKKEFHSNEGNLKENSLLRKKLSHNGETSINKNPKSSNLTHKSEEDLPSFYSGKLMDPSPKENYFEQHLENAKIDDYKFHSLKLPKIFKSTSEKFYPSKPAFYEDDAFLLGDERRESYSYND